MFQLRSVIDFLGAFMHLAQCSGDKPQISRDPNQD